MEDILEKDPLLVPTIEEWDAMTPYERDVEENRIIAALEEESSMMGETTLHFYGRASAAEVLQPYFKKKGRKVFIASDLHTLYPGEKAFYPDLLVVFDVEDKHRSSWNVYNEKKGLDFALEILSRKTRQRDRVEKMNLYARVGIPEYFIFDPGSLTVSGYILNNGKYKEIQPGSEGTLSTVLGLCLNVDNDKIRFNHPEGFEIPFAAELMNRLNDKISAKDHLIKEFSSLLEEEQQKAEEERQKAEEERIRADSEKNRADLAESQLQEKNQLIEKEKSEKEQLLKLLEKHGIDIPN